MPKQLEIIFAKSVDIWRILLYIVSDEFLRLFRPPIMKFTVCFVGAFASLNIPVVTDEGTRPSGGSSHGGSFFGFLKLRRVELMRLKNLFSGTLRLFLSHNTKACGFIGEENTA